MNKKTEYIFGLCSLLGLVITIFLVIAAIVNGQYAPDASALIVSLGVINGVLAYTALRGLLENELSMRNLASVEPNLKLKDEEILKLSEQLKVSQFRLDGLSEVTHNIQDQMRNHMFDLHETISSLYAGEEISDDELIDFSKTNELFYLFLLDNIKKVMDSLTGDNCSVTIKIVEKNEQNIFFLKTFMRDSISYRSRKVSDSNLNVFPYYENTAFYEILSGIKSYYVSDDLAGESTYVNSNNNWKKSYNATLVCPIQIEEVDEEEAQENVMNTIDFSVLGFVCVDNANGGLGNKACIEFLASVADGLYNHLNLFTQLNGWNETSN